MPSLWRRFAAPTTCGWLLLVAGAISLLSPASGDGVSGALRGVATLAVFSLVGLALRVWLARGRADRALMVELSAAGLRSALVMPFFRAELSPAAVARLDAAPRALPTGGLSTLALAFAVAVPGVLATGSLLYTEVAEVALSTAGDAEVVSLVSPAPGAMRNLNARVRLDAPVLVRGEANLPDLRVRSSGAEGAVSVPVSAGESSNAADHSWGVRGLVPNTRIGAATLMATPRAGGSPLRVVVRRGDGVTMPDGTTVALRDGHPSYAGQLGPAVQIAELGPDGVELRQEWVFGRFPGFDAEHGAGHWAFQLVDFALDNDVAFRVSAGPGASSAAALIPAALSVLLALVAVFVARRRSVVQGRDGDWRIEEIGPSSTRASGPSVEFRRELLSPAQSEELSALERAVAGRPS